METTASDEVDAAMHLLVQDDEVASAQPAMANPTAEQLTAGLNRMLNNIAKIGPPPTVTGTHPPLAEQSNGLPFEGTAPPDIKASAVPLWWRATTVTLPFSTFMISKKN